MNKLNQKPLSEEVDTDFGESQNKKNGKLNQSTGPTSNCDFHQKAQPSNFT